MDYGYEGQHFQLMIVLLLLVTNDGMDYGLEVVSIITLASLLSLRIMIVASRPVTDALQWLFCF